ncbi:MAG: hypothetical protein ACI8P0_001906, partial [Planctomycetaceae bacterium]
VPAGSTVLVRDSVFLSDDRDKFAVYLTVGQIVEATVTVAPASSGFIPRIELSDPDINAVAVVDQGALDEPSLMFRVTESGPYYFDVITSSISLTTGDYELSLRVFNADETPLDSVGDTFIDATEVSLGPSETVTVSAEIEFNNDADLFAVDLIKGQELSIDLNAAALAPPSGLDSVVAIFDATGMQVAVNDDIGDVSLDLPIASTGRYYIGISGLNRFGTAPFDPTISSSARSASRGRYDLNLFVTPALFGEQSGILTPFAVDSNEVQIQEAGLFTVRFDPASSGLSRPLIAVATGEGTVLASSAGSRDSSQGIELSIHLPAGTFQVQVSAPDGGSGSYRLQTDFVAALPPLDLIDPIELLQNFRFGFHPDTIASADFNADGNADLAAADIFNLVVFLGVGDGSFTARSTHSIQGSPAFLEAVDLNGDGILDLVSANGAFESSVTENNTISVFIGTGAGTFLPERVFTAGHLPKDIAIADLDSDGILDLAVVNSGSSSVSILSGLGSGRFESPLNVDVPAESDEIETGDFNGDGLPDLAIAGRSSDSVLLLINDGNGSFIQQQTPEFSSTAGAEVLSVADINVDGLPDILVASGNNVEVMTGLPDHSFSQPVVTEFPVLIDGLLVQDLSGDQLPDVVVTESFAKVVVVGTGALDSSFTVGTPLLSNDGVGLGDPLAAADFNNDGRIDLALANGGLTRNGGIGLFLNRGDLLFQPVASGSPSLGRLTTGFEIGDLNGDGVLDVTAVSASSGTDVGSRPSVFLSQGDNSFSLPTRTNVFAEVIKLEDLNLDGRLDLLSVDGQQSDAALTTQFGLGDGSFEFGQQLTTGSRPTAVETSDVNRDGFPDVVVLNQSSNPAASPVIGPEFAHGGATVYLNDGAGHLLEATRLVTGSQPAAITINDLDNDGHPDLVITHDQMTGAGNALLVYWGTGEGEFSDRHQLAIGDALRSVLSVDLDSNGYSDLVTLDLDGVTIYLNETGRAFSAIRLTKDFFEFALLTSLVVSDFDGDQILDIAVTGDSIRDEGLLDFVPTLGVFLGNADGTYSNSRVPSLELPFGAPAFTTMSVADFNADSVDDLAVVDELSGVIEIFLGLGDGTFATENELAKLATQAGPIAVDLNADMIPDVISLDQNGRILFRSGRSEGTVASPITLNPASPARAVLAFEFADAPAIAAVSQSGRTLSVFGFDQSGTSNALTEFDLPEFLSVFVIDDINSDGLDDIVGTLPLTDEIIILRGDAASGFAIPERIHVGDVPATIDLVDFDGQRGLDIVVTSRGSGTVSVLLNDGAGGLSALRPFLTTDETIAVDNSASYAVRSLAEPVAQAIGDFDGDGIADLLVSNAGQRSYTLLTGTEHSYLDPIEFEVAETSIDVPLYGNILLARDLDQDGVLDQVITSSSGQQGIVVLAVSDDLHLQPIQTLTSGGEISGLTLNDQNGDGFVDLLVATEAGDLVIFPGRSDGRFDRIVRTRNAVPIAVQDLDGDGLPEVITANAGFDRVTIAFGDDPHASVTLTQDNVPFAAPGALEIADVNNDGLDDLIVANTGGNEVFIFHRIAEREFVTEPIVLFSGTNPTGVRAEDVNQDGLADLVVANRGSNDVSIFLGSTSTDTGFDKGRRLAAGGGPVSAEVLTDSETGELSGLVVTNADEGTVSMLPAVPGLAGSIFNDQSPSTISIGPTSSQGGQIVNGGYVAANPIDDTFTFIPDLINTFNTGAGAVAFDSRGNEPSYILPTDFNFDGIIDLIVANSGDGGIVLFAGDEFGFVFSDLLSSPTLAHPAAMDIAEINGVLNLFVTDEGEDVATIFELGRDPISLEFFPINPPRPFARAVSLKDGDTFTANTLQTLINYLLSDLNRSSTGLQSPEDSSPFEMPSSSGVRRLLQNIGDALYSILISRTDSSQGENRRNGPLKTDDGDAVQPLADALVDALLDTVIPLLRIWRAPDAPTRKPDEPEIHRADEQNRPSDETVPRENPPASTTRESTDTPPEVQKRRPDRVPVQQNKVGKQASSESNLQTANRVLGPDKTAAIDRLRRLSVTAPPNRRPPALNAGKSTAQTIDGLFEDIVVRPTLAGDVFNRESRGSRQSPES